MDNLKFVSSWRGGIQGSKLPIKLGGIQLEGCSFDGNRLSENQHDSPSVSAIPPCVVAWVTKVTRLSLFLFFFLILPSGMQGNFQNFVISNQKVSPAQLTPAFVSFCLTSVSSSLLPADHWRKLPQVPFLLGQKFCRDRHMFVAINMCLL